MQNAQLMQMSLKTRARKISSHFCSGGRVIYVHLRRYFCRKTSVKELTAVMKELTPLCIAFSTTYSAIAEQISWIYLRIINLILYVILAKVRSWGFTAIQKFWHFCVKSWSIYMCKIFSLLNILKHPATNLILVQPFALPTILILCRCL